MWQRFALRENAWRFAKDQLAEENSLQKGFTNLEKHIQNMQRYDVPVVVAINEFTQDTEGNSTVERSAKR